MKRLSGRMEMDEDLPASCGDLGSDNRKVCAYVYVSLIIIIIIY